MNTAVTAIFVGTLLVVCVLTWLKGRSAERIGTALFCVSVFVTYAFEIVTGAPPPIVIELAFDTFVALGFLLLAIGYNNLWLGAAMIIKGVQLAVHATHLTDVTDPYFAGFNLYAASLNLISLLILLTILGGTLASIFGKQPHTRSHRSPQGDDDAVRQSNL